MKHYSLFYWGILTVLGFLHIHFLFTNLSIDIPFYITAIAIIGACYLLSKRIVFQTDSLGLSRNIFFTTLQILLLFFYIVPQPIWFLWIPVILFIGIEIIRIQVGNILSSYKYELNEVEEERNQMNETFRIVRGERHDFLKHIAAIDFMLENREFDEAKSYLEELVDQYDETNLSIKGERGTVAGILHHMYRRAKESGIEVVYDLDLPLSTLPLTNHEMVTLIGNLLSNSIDACMEWQKERKEKALLTLQFYKRSGLYILICSNSSLPIPKEVLDRLFHSYGHSTKDGHDGLGTKMIMDVVNSHQGFLDFFFKEEEFSIKIKLPSVR